MQNELRRQIRVLRLQAGDIVVVKNMETARRLVEGCKGMAGVPQCPVVIAPEGVEKVSRARLLRLLASTEADTPIARSGDAETTKKPTDGE